MLFLAPTPGFLNSSLTVSCCMVCVCLWGQAMYCTWVFPRSLIGVCVHTQFIPPVVFISLHYSAGVLGKVIARSTRLQHMTGHVFKTYSKITNFTTVSANILFFCGGLNYIFSWEGGGVFKSGSGSTNPLIPCGYPEIHTPTYLIKYLWIIKYTSTT